MVTSNSTRLVSRNDDHHPRGGRARVHIPRLAVFAVAVVVAAGSGIAYVVESGDGATATRTQPPPAHRPAVLEGLSTAPGPVPAAVAHALARAERAGAFG